MGQALFDLVKSLSPSEKRYFRSEHISSEGKAYLRLFDWLEQSEKWEEGQAELEFKGEKFLRQFGVLKNYLKEALMESLRRFHQGNLPLIRLRSRLDHIDLLFRRGLHPQSLKEVRRAKRAAQEAGYLGIYLDLLKWEIKLLRLGGKSGDQIAKLRQESLLTARMAWHEEEVSALFDDTYHLLLHPISDPARFAQKLNALQTEAARLQAVPLGTQGKVILGQVWAYLYRLERNWEKFNEAYAGLVALVESNRHYRNYRNDLARNLYVAYIGSCFLLKRFEESERILPLLSQLPARTQAEKARLAAIEVQLWGQHDIEKRDFQAAVFRNPQVESLFRKHGKSVPTAYAIIIRYNHALSLFLSRQFPLCRKWLQEILNLAPAKNRMDVWEFARLLYPVVLSEIEEFDLLEYEIRNSERFFARRKRLGQFETAVLQFLKEGMKIEREPDSERRVELKQRLEEMPEQERQRPGFEAVRVWLEKK